MKQTRELIVDNFAGGGGASTGIEMAIGHSVDVAINHDPVAILMHKTNHPTTKHYTEDIWEVNPKEATNGQPVALAWFSPDCKHFSKAKGGKPVDKNIRGLAWVAVKWAKAVKPRVIMLENVEEFKTWGPLKADDKGDYYPDPDKKGETFDLFIKALKKLGYKVDFRELKACDYGAPTTRKRFFMIARCDGKKIVWPEPTHGDPEQIEARMGMLKPWRTAAECIDWSISCPSIFDRKKDLAENTLKRIARGIQKFIMDNPKPFIIPIGYGEREGQKPRVNSIDEPLGTVVSSAKHYLVAPFLQHYYTETQENEVRGQSLEEPIATIPTANRFGLVNTFLVKYYGNEIGQSLINPLHTIPTANRFGLVTAFISKYYAGTYEGAGSSLEEPLHTITSKDHNALVQAFLIKYYGTEIGQSLNKPLHTITTKDKFGLVTIKGENYQIVDIGMRMLQPHELFKAQGFPEDYIIDHDYTGKSYPKTAQVARVGNSVSPMIPYALVKANLPELCEDSLPLERIG